uniref:Uncharacterized protein n=1 Tax=Panstrongylus lignarius TaxID=156445 RepID=A0A224XT15_9HEMI
MTMQSSELVLPLMQLLLGNSICSSLHLHYYLSAPSFLIIPLQYISSFHHLHLFCLFQPKTGCQYQYHMHRPPYSIYLL